MSDTRFSDIGKIEAIRRLYEGTGFNAQDELSFEASQKGNAVTSSRMLLEGIDFDLVYFPLKHLGYKSVVSVTGELYASLAHPKVLSIVLGISSKLDFDQVKEIWEGIVAAAKEHKYIKLGLDLVPSKNGLSISVTASGERLNLTSARRLPARSKDLVCVSGSLGAAFLGFKILENGKNDFAKAKEDIEKYRMQVGAYLRPELSANVLDALEESEIYPSFGYFVTRGLADAVKRLGRDSGLGVKIYADKVPFEGNTFQLGKEMDIDPISAAMNGGEDYKLLFTVPILSLEKFRKDFQTFDIIGHLALPEAGISLVTPDGLEHLVSAPGWSESE